MTEVRPLFTTPSRPPPAAGPWGRELRRQRRPAARPDQSVRITLWLPLTPLWLLLAPFALLFAPLLMLLPDVLPDNLPARSSVRRVRAAGGVRPYRTAFALGGLLLALSGTVVDVDAPGARVKIRIF